MACLVISSPAFSKVKKLSRTERMQKKLETLRIRLDAEEARDKLEAEEKEWARRVKEAEDIRRAEQASVTPDTGIKSTNEYIATTWDALNRNVDAFFTDRPSPKVNRSSLFLSLSGTKREGEKFSNEVDFQAKFDFPNATENLKIIIEKQQDEIGNVLNDKALSSSQSTTVKDGKAVSTKDSHYTAGANLLLKNKNNFTSQLKFGIRIDMPLNPSLKLDLQKSYNTNIANISLLQKILFYRQEGLQEISQVSFTRKLNDTFSLDQTNSLVWADENDDFLVRNSLVLSQSLGNEKVISYSVGANARLSPSWYYDSYDTSVSYTQRLYQEWLFTSLTVGAEFPKSRDFKDVKYVQLRFDIFFKEK